MSNLVGTCGFPSPFLSVLYFVTWTGYIYIYTVYNITTIIIIHHPSSIIHHVIYHLSCLIIRTYTFYYFVYYYSVFFIIYYLSFIIIIYIYTLYVYHLLCVVPSPTSTVVTEAWLTPRVTFASHGTISVLSMGRLGDSGDLGGNLQNWNGTVGNLQWYITGWWYTYPSEKWIKMMDHCS